MKKTIHLFFIGFLLLILVGCSINQNDGEENNSAEGKKVINVWCYVDEITMLINKFQELHPDFDYEIKIQNFATMDVDYKAALNQALIDGGPEAPDIYSVEMTYAMKFTQGDAYPYAVDYKELGIDTDTLIKNALLPKYMIDIGTSPDDKLVALGHNSTAGAFIYRRSIAKEVWGTDDPSIIRDIVGPGWEKFFEAAADLREKGYGICSGIGDIWIPVERSADQGWVVDGKLVIDPKREALLDYARKLIENDYTNNTQQWSDGWFADMCDDGEKKIFGFFGPAWFINYDIANYCGGEAIGEGTYGDWAVCDPPEGFYWGGSMILANKDTEHKAAVGEIIKWITLDISENGCQYSWANGAINGNKEIAASAAVMKGLDGRNDFLGGQDIFEAYISAGEYARGANYSEYDIAINDYWISQVREYAQGIKSREKALVDFKQQVAGFLQDVIVE